MRPVRVAFRKWDGQPHWEYDAILLGTDRNGIWLGSPAGTPVGRPGLAFATEYGHLSLVQDGVGFVASFYEDTPIAAFAIYVDISTPPRWDDATVSAVDLDLDVIRTRDGRVWIDDEDEFAEHRVTMGYPEEIAAAARRTCAEVHRAVVAGEPPFDGATAAHWFDVLAARSVNG